MRRHEELVSQIDTEARDMSLEMVLGKRYPCLKTTNCFLLQATKKTIKPQKENTKEMLQALTIANAWGSKTSKHRQQNKKWGNGITTN